MLRQKHESEIFHPFRGKYDRPSHREVPILAGACSNGDLFIIADHITIVYYKPTVGGKRSMMEINGEIQHFEINI